MASKEVKTMRLSEDIIEMIEQQVGENFTQKFENLVTKCCWELPQRKEELRMIEEQIKQRGETLRRISRKANELDNLIFRMTSNVQAFTRQTGEAMKNLERLVEES